LSQARAELQPIDDNARQQIQHALGHLEDHLIVKFGDKGAVIRAQMLLDACGPGRNIDPKSLFKEDSDGDDWSDAIANLSF